MMPREILRNNKDRTMSRVAPDTSQQQSRRSGIQQRVRKEPRSKRYLQMFQNVDTGVHGGETDTSALEELIAAEFPGFDEFLPLGIVAQCYLGPPYEVHTIDRLGYSILHHYKVGEALTNGMERARKLALHPSYDMIEVYEDRIVAIHGNGATTEIEDK